MTQSKREQGVFSGKVALVSGGARGIGLACATDLAKKGATVVIFDNGATIDGTADDPEVVQGAARDIMRDAGCVVVPRSESVGRTEDVDRVMSFLESQYGRLDILVHSAGIMRMKPLEQTTLCDIQDSFDVHAAGAFLMAQRSFSLMKKNGGGCCLFMSSPIAFFGADNVVSYAMSKAAIIGLSQSIATEGGPLGIRSNVVFPFARTRMTRGHLGPFASLVDTDWISPFVSYLAMDDTSETGGVFLVGGGRYSRVFCGITKGWTAQAIPAYGDIGARMMEVMDMSDYDIDRLMEDVAKNLLGSIASRDSSYGDR